MRSFQPVVAVDPAVVTVAHEYRRLGFVRRLALRWVSPELSRAARHMAAGVRTDVRYPQQPGPVTRAVDSFFAQQ